MRNENKVGTSTSLSIKIQKTVLRQDQYKKSEEK